MKLDIFTPIIKLVNKLFPDGDHKLDVLLAIEQARSSLKQPLALSIISIMVYLNFAIKTIIYRLQMVVYFNTVEWYTDMVFVAIVFSFQFGIPFKDIIKSISEFRRKK